jgi:diguanylate cyclase (GGDEF)-like protein
VRDVSQRLSVRALGRLPRGVQCLLLAALYGGAGALGLATIELYGAASALWPPAGLALAALVLLGPRLWPGVALGALLVNLGNGHDPGAALLVTAGNVGEAVVGWWALRRAGFRPDLSRVRDVAALLLLAAAAATLVSAVIGPAVVAIEEGLSLEQAVRTAWVWWIGDMGGILIVTPLLLALATRGTRRPARHRLAEVVLLVALTSLALAAFATSSTHQYLLIPPLVWASLRFGVTGAACANFAAGCFVAWATVRGYGAFAEASLGSSLSNSQTFTVVAATTSLVLAAVEDQRRRGLARIARQASEQAALGDVAQAVAEGASVERLAALIARELRLVTHTTSGWVTRFEGEESLVLAMDQRGDDPATRAGTRFPVREVELARLVLRRGRPAVTEQPEAGVPRYSVAAPVRVGERVWGMVGATDDTTPPPGSTEVLQRFADLLGLALASSESRAELETRATSDPLTGLANHRTFHERLGEEFERARRHDRPLAVAVFDLDNLKEVNDAGGHAAGDALIAEVAGRLAGAARTGELAGRLGGDEFALLLPETDGLGAFRAAERIRRQVAGLPLPASGRPVTLSAGVAGTEHATTADELLRLADGALYWAKANGRNVCFRYTPEVVRELSAQERADRLTRAQALSGLRALARAIDARDGSTRRHSERVADLAARLARTRGWEEDRVALLREAGLVHDVGKIGIPDAILFKRGPLDADEYERVKDHAELGARIAGEVLSAEQADWIRWHHERPDGRGYPDALRGADVPDGASILALADAWDVMTVARAYTVPISPAEALDTCSGLAGAQFEAGAVAALEELARTGELDPSLGGAAADR